VQRNFWGPVTTIPGGAIRSISPWGLKLLDNQHHIRVGFCLHMSTPSTHVLFRRLTGQLRAQLRTLRKPAKLLRTSITLEVSSLGPQHRTSECRSWDSLLIFAPHPGTAGSVIARGIESTFPITSWRGSHLGTGGSYSCRTVL